MVSRSAALTMLFLALGLLTIAKLRRPAASKTRADYQSLRQRYHDDIAYMEDVQRETRGRFNDDETD